MTEVAPTLYTPRQQDLLALMNKGQSNRAISEALQISEHTVKVHLWRLFKQLGVRSRTQAVNRWRLEQEGPDPVAQIQALKQANASLFTELKNQRKKNPSRLPFVVSPEQMTVLESIQCDEKSSLSTATELLEFGLVYHLGGGQYGLTRVGAALLTGTLTAS